MSGIGATALHIELMKPAKPAFPDPDHDHGRCAEDAFSHAEKVCVGRGQKFTPIRRQVLGALLGVAGEVTRGEPSAARRV